MDWNLNRRPIRLLPHNFVNVEGKPFSVHGCYFTDLLSLKVSPHYLNLVVLPHRHGPDVVLDPQLLGQGSGHEFPPNVGRGREVPLPILPPRHGHLRIPLHLIFLSPPPQKTGN